MNLDDLASVLKDAQNVTININAGNGEMYTAPVQINQTENHATAGSVSAPDDADDYIPRCLYCGWDTPALVYDDGLYYHPGCKYLDEHPSAPDSASPVRAWVVVDSEPDTPPEPEPVIPLIEAPRPKTWREEIEERYAGSYAELVSNGIKHGLEICAFSDSITAELAAGKYSMRE